MNNFNDWLWTVINAAGWWWWIPCIIVAAINLVLLTKLSPPVTTTGAVARGFAWLAHLPLLFVGIAALVGYFMHTSVSLNALGLLSLPLMLISNNILYTQLWLACRREKRTLAYHPRYGAARALRTVIGGHD